MKPLLTVKKAASRAGVSEKTILDWVNRGLLRARRKGFGITSAILIYRDSFEERMKQREIPAQKK